MSLSVDASPGRHDLQADVAIVGAGLAGLTAARLLTQAGVEVVLEAGDLAMPSDCGRMPVCTYAKFP
jgi:flavin-dependent dehydrogenase